METIKTVEDVTAFAKEIVADGVSFHPDDDFDDFNDYVEFKSGKATYTEKEAALRNKLMEQCFDICEKEGVDIYEVMNEVLVKETGLDKLFGPPSMD